MSGEVLSMGPEADIWLPSDFLADDDLFFLHKQESKKSGAGSPCPLGFPTEFPYDYLSSDSFSSSSSSSNPSSPVESATESEDQSDDDLDEYLAGLTTQMAHSFLQETEEDASVSGADKNNKLACSPLSPVCTSVTGPSLEATFLSESETSKPPSTPSPPPAEAPTNEDDTALDALYPAAVAADQGERMKQLQQQKDAMGSIVFGGLSFPVGVPQALESGGFVVSDACVGLGNYHYHYNNNYRKPGLSQHQLQVAQQLKHQQLVNQQLAAAAAWRQRRQNGSPAAGGSPHHLPLGLPSSAWPSLQPPVSLGIGKSQHGIGVGVIPPPPPPPQSGSGMRAVFLPGGLGQKPSTGTGVFLPRRAWSPTQMRRKPGCSRVLMPARVVHALNNLNLEAAAAAAAATTGTAVGETLASGHCGGGGVVPSRRPPQLHGVCVGVGHSADADTRAGGNGGGAAVASYSSLVDGGGGGGGGRGGAGPAKNEKNNSNNYYTSSCGGGSGGEHHLRVGLSVGRRLLAQEEMQLLMVKQQQQHVQQPPSPSPETRLPPEWIY